MHRFLCLPLHLLGCFVCLFCSSTALALNIQIPAGGESITLPDGKVLCGTAPGGFIADGTRRRIRPRVDLPVGSTANVAIASSFSECASGPMTETTLVVTGEHPIIDAASITVWVDAGRLELQGKGLEGVRIAWQSGDLVGSDVCLNVLVENGVERCALNVSKGLPANPIGIELTWVPAGGRVGQDTATFDHDGNQLPEDRLRLPIGRIIVGHVFPVSRTVDVARGDGRIELPHPEAVSSADCGAAQCEVASWGILVGAVPADSTAIQLRIRLQPRVFLARGEQQVRTESATFSVLRCPITIVSGQPLRNADDLKVLVRADKTCGGDIDDLHWTAAGETVEVIRVESLPDGVYALLRIGRTASDRLRLVASRVSDRSVVAVVSERTWEAPPLTTTLRLPSVGSIDFIPKNREALLTVSSVEGPGTLAPVTVPGAYEVTKKKGRYYVRGAYSSGGYTSLRFAYLIPTLPGSFADEYYAMLSDPVQRPIREANIPAPIGASSVSKLPIVELYCAVKEDKVEFIEPGTSRHIPFSERDSCRLVIHRKRIPPASGEQHLHVEVSVTTVGGSERGEARLSEQLILRHGTKRDVIWIRGAQQQFDRINIRVTHVIDESQYMVGARGTLELPSAQWNVITENADFKFYATAAIPASLYRFSKDPGDLGTGPLALNFGVLSRLTWLDSEGHEGLIGLEAGVMGMGLASDSDRQLAIVGGLGVAIPLGNPNQPTQAAVNIHAWIAYSIGERTARLTNDDGEFVRDVTLSPWAFVFGPSITIGSVGAFL